MLATRATNDATSTAQKHQVNYRSALFTYLGSIRRQYQRRGLEDLLAICESFLVDDLEQRQPKFLVDRSTHGSHAGELAGSSTTTMSSPTSNPPVAVSSTTPAPPATSPPATSTPATSPPATSTPATSPPATSTPATASLSTAHNLSDDTEDVASYTTLLKELGDEECKMAVYKEDMIRFEPPLWRYTVNFGDVRGVGEGPKKRTAKHKASKAAWLQLEHLVAV